MRAIFTIGHSTRPIEEFIELLQTNGVEQLIDIRTVPSSRRNPQFNREMLPDSLTAAGIGYLHMPALGGLRHPRPDSPNSAWRNDSFRGYADYMQTPEFAAAIEKLIELGQREADRHHVRRGGAVALPPVAGRGCAHGARHRSGRHHERRAPAAAQAHAVRAE